jgi:hypothetical protein
VRTRPDGDHDGWVARGYLFNCLYLVEPVLRIRGNFRAALSQKAAAGAQTTCGSPGASPSRETGAGAAGTRGGPGVERRELEPHGHVVAPELPRA